MAGGGRRNVYALCIMQFRLQTHWPSTVTTGPYAFSDLCIITICIITISTVYEIYTEARFTVTRPLRTGTTESEWL